MSSHIGVIALYNEQVSLIRHLASQDSADLSLRDLEVNTVDQYQGRDKSCIILSFVKTTLKSSEQVNYASVHK